LPAVPSVKPGDDGGIPFNRCGLKLRIEASMALAEVDHKKKWLSLRLGTASNDCLPYENLRIFLKLYISLMKQK
jgi:hypothetical protein